MKNISNLTLIGILVLLVLAYLGVDYFKSKSRKSSFPDQLVDFNPKKATGLEIYSTDDSVFLVKEKEDWKLKLKSGKIVDAEDGSVERVLETLLTIKPNRLATKDETKWEEFQVDTKGTRVKVYEKGKAVGDLIVGRFGMNQNQSPQSMYGMPGMGQFYSYVRLTDEPSVYVVDNFMSFSLPSNPTNYRIDKVTDIKTDSLTEISFQYPADSSFNMTKKDGKWEINGQPADSSSVVSYLNNVRNYTHRLFADDVEPSGSPLLNVEFKLQGSDNVRVEAFSYDSGQWIIRSTQNESLLLDTANVVKDEIFVGKSRFMRN